MRLVDGRAPRFVAFQRHAFSGRPKVEPAGIAEGQSVIAGLELTPRVPTRAAANEIDVVLGVIHNRTGVAKLHFQRLSDGRGLGQDDKSGPIVGVARECDRPTLLKELDRSPVYQDFLDFQTARQTERERPAIRLVDREASSSDDRCRQVIC